MASSCRPGSAAGRRTAWPRWARSTRPSPGEVSKRTSRPWRRGPRRGPAGRGVLAEEPGRGRPPSSSAWRPRNAIIGAFESTTRHLLPGSRTTTSGRIRRSCRLTAETCSSKSHRASRPACSRTRRSCTSPQAPRTVEALSEPASEAVCAPQRADVDACTLRDRLARERRTGRARSRSRVADLPLDPAEGVAQRSQRGGGLGVVGQRRLEVDDALAQQVALRVDRAGAGRHHRGASRTATTTPTARPTSTPRSDPRTSHTAGTRHRQGRARR